MREIPFDPTFFSKRIISREEDGFVSMLSSFVNCKVVMNIRANDLILAKCTGEIFISTLLFSFSRDSSLTTLRSIVTNEVRVVDALVWKTDDKLDTSMNFHFREKYSEYFCY